MQRIVALSLLLAPTRANAQDSRSEDSEFITGVSLTSIGAAAALAMNIGNLIHIGEGSHSGAWGWVGLLAAATTTAGGILTANAPYGIQPLGVATIAYGVVSLVTSIAGLALPRAAEHQIAKRRWHLAPTWIVDAEGRRSGGLLIGGIF